MRIRSTAPALAVALAAAASTAVANPRPLPFTYTTETLPPGGVEIEQFADITPLRGKNGASGAPQWYLGSQFQTEIEVGLPIERLELGIYFTYVPSLAYDRITSTGLMTEGNGLKQRLRYTFANPGEWPIDLGVYGELTENDHEIEFEGKLLLQRRFGALRVAANLWAEYEIEFGLAHDVVLDPSAGATYEITPALHVGLDSWLRSEYPSNAPAVRPYGLGPVVYVGPAIQYDFGKLWWSVGAYARVTDIDHTMQPGEPYGPIWIRSMVGYAL